MHRDDHDSHAADSTRSAPDAAHNPDAAGAPGASTEKRDQARRNDPESMPGATQGNPARRSGEGPPGNPGNRER